MAFTQSDRISMSLAVVTTAAQINNISAAQAQLQSKMTTLQSLDTANANLLNSANNLITDYQLELGYLNGIQRTSFVEQNILDAANKVLQNDFFPNNSAATVPSISSLNNLWNQFNPYALNFAIGKTYSESYNSISNEIPLINNVLTLISTALTIPDIENTTGEMCSTGGICSLPQYLDQSDCVSGSGSWTSGSDAIVVNMTVQTLKTNIVSAVNALINFVGIEVSSIVSNDPNAGNQIQNNAAISNINSILLPAINTWLSYPDFHPLAVASCAEFNSYNASLLSPTKLYSADITALQTALNNRLSFIATRETQLNTILGTIVQNITSGAITSSSGLYGTRYAYLNMRLNTITGSLSQLVALQNTIAAQTTIQNNLVANENTYTSILPTSLLAAAGNGTAIINLVNSSFLNVGDTVYIYGEGQQELQRAVRSINNTVVVLNDIIPQKYDPNINNARLYKDIS